MNLRILLATITMSIGQWKGPPEKDKALLYNSGKYIMQGFMAGIDSMVPSLKNQLGQLTTQVQQQVNVTPGSGGGTVNNVTLNTTINTHEIDPQRNATQLGRLLVGRIV